MPELKRNFMQGRMNKDLDERIVPDGEYRDALNIEVSTAEESSVGTARNVPGNQLLGSVRLNDRFWKGTNNSVPSQGTDPFNYYQPDNGTDFSDSAETVGVATDPATDKIYSLVASIIEPHYVPAGTKTQPAIAPTTYSKTIQANTTDSLTVTLNNVTDLAVGMVVVASASMTLNGGEVVFGSIIKSIDTTSNTITLNKSNSLPVGEALDFSKAALVGYDVDAILETRSASYQATSQSGRLKGIFVDVYNVYRVPPLPLTLWTTGADVNNTTGARGEDTTIIYMSENTGGTTASQTGNMNFANGIYKGATFELIVDGVNILTPNLTNPITGNAIGTVKVASVKRSKYVGANFNTYASIQVTLNKAIPDGLVTTANIQNGLSYKFSNERLLDFKKGTPLNYTETNSSGTKLIENHPTPIDTKITGIDVVDGTIYFTDGRTEPKRIDIEKGIKGSNYITNLNNVNNNGADPAYSLMLFETSQLEYENPISQKFGENPNSSQFNNGLGIVQQLKRKPYELEDITVIRRHPLNPPTVDLKRSKRVGLTHNIGLKAGTGINSNTAIGSVITFTVTKNKSRDFAFPSYYTGTVDDSNNIKNHSWRPGDILVLDTLHSYSNTTSGSGSDSASRRLRVQITSTGDTGHVAITHGTFSMPTVTDETANDYHDTIGAKVVNEYRDAEHGVYDFSTNPGTPTYQKYDDMLTVTATVIEKNNALSKDNTSTPPLTYFEASLEDTEASLFTDKFPRFAIRYKYDDNQFSALSPFTEPCFLPETNYMWDKEEGQNAAMVNSIRQIVLRDFITPSTPVDVKRIDVLVKFDGENNIYQVDSIKKGSREWNDDNGKYAKTILGPNALVTSGPNATFNVQQSKIHSGRYPNFSYGNTRGVYYVNSEKLGAVIPSNQILRPFDAVPIKAKAQCISANRLIYGNYSLDYDLVTADNKTVIPRLFYSWRDPEDSRRSSFREMSYSNKDNYRKYGMPEKSIKGNRTYTLGISFLDRFGRQSPVIVGPESSYTSSQNSSYMSSRLRAKLELEGGIPYWATHYRYYIKETSNEYYNIALYRAYPAEGDGSDEDNRTTAYWLAFHSADRNKIQEDSILRLKSRGGGGSAWQYGEELFRVLDISNEAPKSDGPSPEVEVLIPPKQRKGKFYVKVKASEKLIKGLKGPFGGANTQFGGTLSDYHVPAIFETIPDPDIGLNIFYEVPRTYPIKLTDKTIEDFVNFGDFVACYRTGYDTDGDDHSIPTFKAFIDDPAGGGTPIQYNSTSGTGTKPDELFHLFDGKQRTVLEDLTTKVLALRGSELEDGVQRLQLDAFRNFGVPVLDNGAPTFFNGSSFYLAGTATGVPATLIADGNYQGDPATAQHATVGSQDNFGSLQIYRLDGTKSSVTINNLRDNIPNLGGIGMGYQSSGNTNVFDNNQSYTNTNTVQFNSLVFGSENTLPFHNCWHFGNGVESDRIRDDFNAPMLDNGVKASSTSDTYGRKDYKHGLIFSGLYNSKTDINNLNQFIKAEGITKDLNPEYGSIQKLFTRNTNILAFCENKVLKILSNKDALFNADGNTNLTSSKAVLGTAVPFSGDHGISRNPESFAEDEFRCYFTDRDRGAVCRLSMDGITAVSSIGMSDYFADELKSAVACVGAFNDKKGEYDLTIHNNLGVDDADSNSAVDVTKRVQTISFNEKTNSWVSFKSYAIEQGLSINNEYYTLKKGRVYLHSDDAVHGRNNFYGTQYFSSITPIFNDAPGSIKSFQTINYEGTQAQVIANSRTGTTNGAHNSTTTLTLTSIPTGLTVGQVVTGNDFTLPTSFQLTPVTVTAINTGANQLTLSSAVSIATAKTVVFSDAEYYNDDAYTGWYVESITTDQQEGQVLEFKEKEGKWFNNISGVATTFTNDIGGGNGTGNIDSQEFSVQGIGSLNSISGAGNSGLFYFSKVQATVYMSCDTDGNGLTNDVTVNNIEYNIPHGTNFATYSSFDDGTGQQKITLCPPSGYSFVDPATYDNSTQTYTPSSLTVTVSTATTSAYTATITQATTPTDCISIVVDWDAGFTPNQDTVVHLLVAQSFGPTVLAPVYNYQLPLDIDLAWEEGASPEWIIESVTAIDANVDVSPLTVGDANVNQEFVQYFSATGQSGNDSSAMLTGSFDYTTTSSTFEVVYKAQNGHYFPAVTSTSTQAIIDSFLFPNPLGFPLDNSFLIDSGSYTGSFYNPGSGVAAYFGTSQFDQLFSVTWDFTNYNNNGQATQLTATYTYNPLGVSGISNSLLYYYNSFGCDPTSTSNTNFTWGDLMLLWEPVQDIGGGEEPVIPDGGSTTGEADDVFDEPDPLEEFVVNVNVVHQSSSGGASVGVSVQNTSFTVIEGSSLNQSTAQCVISPLAGFTINEANITHVDGNTDNTPVSGVATYIDGVGGDTLTANIQSISIEDSGGSPNSVFVNFTFENVIVTNNMTISIIIKADASDLSGTEVLHRLGTTLMGLTAPEDQTEQTVFGNGSSGELMDTAAPASQYSISVDDHQTIANSSIACESVVDGTSSNGVERTVATYTFKTKSGHRFVTNGDSNGFVGFLEDAGLNYTSSSDHATRIQSWLVGHFNHIVDLNAVNGPGYSISFAVNVTNSGASNVQEEVVVTVKYTGNGSFASDTLRLFNHKEYNVIAADHDNAYFS